MNWSFIKGVLTGVGGLLLFFWITSVAGWVPWLLLGAGGAYAFYRVSKSNPESLEDPASKARQIVDEVDKRIDDFRRSR